MSLRIRRGTEAQRLGFTPDLGEIIWTTNGEKLYVGDGVTPGGKDVAAQLAGVGLQYNGSTGKLDSIASFTTDQIAEGVNNKYFSNELAQDAVAAALVAGVHSGISFVYNSTQDTGNRIDATVSLTLDNLSDVVISGTPTNGQVLKYNTSTSRWEAGADVDTTGLINVVDDTSPQLGGDLDLNSKVINGSGSININGTISANLGLGADLDLNTNDIVGTGNIDITGSVSTGGLTIDNNSITGNNIYLGQATAPARTEFYLSDNAAFRQVVNPILGNYLNSIQCRGTLTAPAAVNTGDVLGGLLVKAHTSESNIAISGFVSVQVDSTSTVNPVSEYIKSKIAVGACTDSSLNSANSLLIDSDGVATIKTFSGTVCLQTAVYADQAAITSAISVPAKGMIVFDDDTNQFKGWTGDAWVALN